MNVRGDVILKTRAREGEEPRAFTLVLSMQALAEIELMFEVKSVQEAFDRFRPASGSPSMVDLLKLLTCLIRAGGEHDFTFEDIMRERFDAGEITAALDILFKGAGEFAAKEDGKKPVARPPQRTGRAGS